MSYGSKPFDERELGIISNLKLLKEENWKAANHDERIAVLQECELKISTFERRSTCSVRSHTFTEANIAGSFSPDSNKIQISKELVDGVSPYRALSVLIEESHHAFQAHACKNPGFYKGAHMEEWRANFENYQHPPNERDPPEERDMKQKLYENQPLELTAKDVSTKVVRDLIREHEVQRSQEELDREAEKNKSQNFSAVKAPSKEETLEQKPNSINKKPSFELREGSKGMELVVRNESGKEQSIELATFISKLSDEQKQKLVDLAEARKSSSKSYDLQVEQKQISGSDRQQEKERKRDR